jgi:UDP-2,3-diacylglucosamine hydrolase
MAVAIVADAHLGGPGGPARELVEQLDGLNRERCERLILLGDIFQVWIAFPAFETPDVTQLLAAVDRLRQRGVRVEYIEGNRDFFLAQGPYRHRFDAVLLHTEFEAAGQRVLATHGDGLNDNDWAYRFWRRLSKSAPILWLVRALPTPVVRWWIATTERRLGRSNFKHKREIPLKVLQTFGARRLGEGFQRVVLGHFHEAHRIAAPGGEVQILDAWFNSRSIEWFD